MPHAAARLNLLLGFKRGRDRNRHHREVCTLENRLDVLANRMSSPPHFSFAAKKRVRDRNRHHRKVCTLEKRLAPGEKQTTPARLTLLSLKKRVRDRNRHHRKVCTLEICLDSALVSGARAAARLTLSAIIAYNGCILNYNVYNIIIIINENEKKALGVEGNMHNST